MKNTLRMFLVLLFCVLLSWCFHSTAFADGESVVIPKNVAEIREEAFSGCTEMTSVTIPMSVTHIYSNAFADCENLSDVYYDGTLKQWAALSIDAGNETIINARHIFLGEHPVTETVQINGKDYTARFCGRVDKWWAEYIAYLDFWTLENAYDDFKDTSRNGDNLPDWNYPMSIEAGQVYMVDCRQKDGRAYRQIMRCDGNVSGNGWLITHGLIVDIAPIYYEAITVNEKDYWASFWGGRLISSWSEHFSSREFWRLENAYNDLKDCRRFGDNLPADNYMMPVQVGQVYIVDYYQKDGRAFRELMRCDGNYSDGRLVTHAIAVDVPPLYTELLNVGGKYYTAGYYGIWPLPDSDEQYSNRAFWRLENAYDDLRNCRFANEGLLERNYPMAVEGGQVYVVDYTRRSGGLERMVMRCDGEIVEGMLETYRIVVD